MRKIACLILGVLSSSALIAENNQGHLDDVTMNIIDESGTLLSKNDVSSIFFDGNLNGVSLNESFSSELDDTILGAIDLVDLEQGGEFESFNTRPADSDNATYFYDGIVSDDFFDDTPGDNVLPLPVFEPEEVVLDDFEGHSPLEDIALEVDLDDSLTLVERGEPSEAF